MKLPEWYDRVEAPLRELVHILRNSGFNTTCSCGHYPCPSIEMEWYDPTEMTDLYNILIEKGYKNWVLDMTWDYQINRKGLEIKFMPSGCWTKTYEEGLVPLKDILSSKQIRNCEGHVWKYVDKNKTLRICELCDVTEERCIPYKTWKPLIRELWDGLRKDRL